MFKKILTCMVMGLGLTLPAQADDHAIGGNNENTEMEWNHRKGMRLGWVYLNNGEEHERLKSPHMFTMGYEIQSVMDGGSWLDLLFIQNVLVSGLDQSVLLPSASSLVGFEINDTLQLAVGGNVTVVDPANQGNLVHLVAAAGATFDAGIFSVPVHIIYIPDINGYYRVAATTGVNW